MYRCQTAPGTGDRTAVNGLPLYVNRDARHDWLIALEFGRVCDGRPARLLRPVGDDFAFVLDDDARRVIGFGVSRLRAFDADGWEHEAIWREPRFDAPLLALAAATAGEIVVAAQGRLAHTSTTNRRLFDRATRLDGPAAVGAWRRCLEAGDAMAHYGLGCALLAAGRPREAHPHLRRYTELAPANAWAWCSLGRASEAIGERAAARGAYARAMTVGGDTDAPQLLAELEGAA